MKTTAKAEARDRAQFILGAVSLVIWFIVAFALGVRWYIDDDTAQPILMAGGIALLVSAVPWLAYSWLVRRLSRDAGDRSHLPST